MTSSNTLCCPLWCFFNEEFYSFMSSIEKLLFSLVQHIEYKFLICACHPCTGFMQIFSVSFQFYWMSPKGLDFSFLVSFFQLIFSAAKWSLIYQVFLCYEHFETCDDWSSYLVIQYWFMNTIFNVISRPTSGSSRKKWSFSKTSLIKILLWVWYAVIN